jgi:hypothetical protein
MSSRKAFDSSPFFSTKHSTYFQAYDELLTDFKNKEIVFLEVGVLEGGSLFMWKEFFGPKARIIGVDLNPLAKKWESYGFEIFIGNQNDEEFWKLLHKQIGNVDVVLDDGGHTFRQQTTTALNVIPIINDGGQLIVEDTHTSYMTGFGNHKYSFMKWAYSLCDVINSRFSGFDTKPVGSATAPVWRVSFFESIVSFHVDRSKASLPSLRVENSGTRDNAVDIQTDNMMPKQILRIVQHLRFLKIVPFSNYFYNWIVQLRNSDTKSLRSLFRRLKS